MSVTRLDTVNVTKPCRACGANVATSHDRIPVCAGCRSRGLAGSDEVRESNKQIADAYGALSMCDTGSGASVADLINDLRKMWQQEAEAARKQIRGKIRKMHTPQAAQEPKPVREVDRNPDKVARTTIAGLPALSEDKDGPRRRHAVKHARGYVLYDEDDRIVACEATDDVALGWCQFGWPYGAAWVLDGVLPER